MTRSFAGTVAFACFIGVAQAACSSAPGSSETEDVGTAEQAQSIHCSSSTTCCTGSAMPFTTDPFEVQLQKWGCYKPWPYEPNQATGAWWMYSECPDAGKKIETFLASHPQYTAAPYYAQVTTSLNPLCVSPPSGGDVDVVFDPTCTTCRLK